jgi:DnaJ homolog subfamily A member 2
MDYYNILGISKTASSSEIKKAYYKLSKEHHPDRGGSEEKFKACNEAYQVLIDPEKKALYDKFGKEGLNQNHFDPFSGFGFNPFGFNQGFQQQSKKAADKEVFYEISLSDLYHGTTIKYEFTRTVICKDCQGRGTSKDINIVCSDCQGRKQKVTMTRQGNTVFQNVEMCPSCQGKGISIKDKDKCKCCKGNRISEENTVLNIDIVRGMFWGDILKFNGFGNEKPDAISGDLLFRLEPQSIEYITRVKDDLIYHLSINLLQALGGKEIILKHLNGETLTIVDKISPGDVKKLPGYGMPIRNTGDYGDLYIKFQLCLKDLQSDYVEKIINILNPNLTEQLKGLSLETVKELPSNSNETNDDYYEHGQHGQPGVQCAQQ